METTSKWRVVYAQQNCSDTTGNHAHRDHTEHSFVQEEIYYTYQLTQLTNLPRSTLAPPTPEFAQKR
jgi:hypothetical protein